MSLHNSKWLLFKRKILKLLTIAMKFGHFKSFSIFGGFSSLIWRIQKKYPFCRIFFKFWCFIYPPWSHVRSHTKFGPDRFIRFDVYRTQTDRQAKYIKRCPSQKLLEMSVLYKKIFKILHYILISPSSSFFRSSSCWAAAAAFFRASGVSRASSVTYFGKGFVRSIP